MEGKKKYAADTIKKRAHIGEDFTHDTLLITEIKSNEKMI